jgi:hypothetical protein
MKFCRIFFSTFCGYVLVSDFLNSRSTYQPRKDESLKWRFQPKMPLYNFQASSSFGWGCTGRLKSLWRAGDVTDVAYAERLAWVKNRKTLVIWLFAGLNQFIYPPWLYSSSMLLKRAPGGMSKPFLRLPDMWKQEHLQHTAPFYAYLEVQFQWTKWIYFTMYPNSWGSSHSSSRKSNLNCTPK